MRDEQTRTAGYHPEGIDDALMSDHTVDHGAGPSSPGDPATLPELGAVGWARWVWRQLTSMRVALLLLTLLAVAAVPGSVLPQRPQDPARVAEYLETHAAAGPWLDRLGMFDVYASPWFSAIYLLLFVSLVGCILPRSRAHLAALRARPVRVPRRFDRFPAQGSLTVDAAPEQVAEAAAAHLRGHRRMLPTFRTDVRPEPDGVWAVSAERGYLRETGNLVFHLALVGLLVSVATGQMLHYRGQAVVIEGRGFANAVVDYDTFDNGAAFDPSSLVPFTLTLDGFASSFDPDTLQPRDFRADVTVTLPGEEPRADTIKVNRPLDVGGAKVYLQGNGYAPDLTVRDADGNVAFAGPVPFLPQDEVYTSRGVVKVPDVSSGDQIGLVGYLLPTAEEFGEDLYRSTDPQPNDPLLALAVWTGDLGLDDGVPQNVHELDETGMTQAVDADGQPVTLYLRPGETVELPDGLGTVTFDDLPRFVALDLRHDPALGLVLVFALAALGGLATSLFLPRRRVWLRAVPDGAGRTVVAAAALARGDDLALQGEVDALVDALRAPDGGTIGRPDGGTGDPAGGAGTDVGNGAPVVGAGDGTER